MELVARNIRKGVKRMSRELYDLCRKYKYNYKKLNILKEADDKVYDKHLKKAVASTEAELKVLENDLCQYMLDEVFNPIEISIESVFGGKGASYMEMRGVINQSFIDWLRSDPCRRGWCSNVRR